MRKSISVDGANVWSWVAEGAFWRKAYSSSSDHSHNPSFLASHIYLSRGQTSHPLIFGKNHYSSRAGHLPLCSSTITRPQCRNRSSHQTTRPCRLLLLMDSARQVTRPHPKSLGHPHFVNLVSHPTASTLTSMPLRSIMAVMEISIDSPASPLLLAPHPIWPRPLLTETRVTKVEVEVGVAVGAVV